MYILIRALRTLLQIPCYRLLVREGDNEIFRYIFNADAGACQVVRPYCHRLGRWVVGRLEEEHQFDAEPKLCYNGQWRHLRVIVG